MKRYLGETAVDVASHPKFSKHERADWAMLFVSLYGGIDGAHHKDWVLDQVARILHGTPVIVTEAKWDNGETEFRYSTGIPNVAYSTWVEEMLGDTTEDGDREYEYSVGIAP